MTDTLDEARFRGIFSHLGAITAYAARRGSRDPDGVAAEVMTMQAALTNTQGAPLTQLDVEGT